MNRNIKQKQIVFTFENESVCEEWYEKMMMNNQSKQPAFHYQIDQMEKCYKVYMNRGIFSIYQNSLTITHPVFNMIKDDKYYDILSAV